MTLHYQNKREMLIVFVIFPAMYPDTQMVSPFEYIPKQANCFCAEHVAVFVFVHIFVCLLNKTIVFFDEIPGLALYIVYIVFCTFLESESALVMFSIFSAMFSPFECIPKQTSCFWAEHLKFALTAVLFL